MAHQIRYNKIGNEIQKIDGSAFGQIRKETATMYFVEFYDRRGYRNDMYVKKISTVEIPDGREPIDG
jgi:hypothetical protein